MQPVHSQTPHAAVYQDFAVPQPFAGQGYHPPMSDGMAGVRFPHQMPQNAILEPSLMSASQGAMMWDAQVQQMSALHGSPTQYNSQYSDMPDYGQGVGHEDWRGQYGHT